ncbi:hypothetical protein SEA_SADLAD_11 [Microbacterium phage SadLad]|nr:hypothetical protein SEA_SADLAD_11 [Microbacterium phage SadLad]
MNVVLWRKRPTRHTRRYRNEARYPYVVKWGKGNPSFHRTLIGARIRAWWITVIRPHMHDVWIEEGR